jgi:hypothetical protein
MSTILANPSTPIDGKANAQTALNDLQNSLSRVKSTVSSRDKPKIDAAQSSIIQLKSTINNTHGLSDMSALVTASNKLATSAQGVLDALKTGCPSS